MSSDEFTKPATTVPTYTTTRDMDSYPGFPMSIIVTGFFVTSLAYLVCFCCCIIQFFIRRSREMRQNGTAAPAGSQKNDTLKRRFLKQFRNSLRKLQRTTTGDGKELQMIREMSTLGSTSSCPICFDEYTGDPAEILMGKIKSCGHFYHFDCIWTWLEARGNCPLCREKVALKEDDIQALALRHLLHELKKNAQDHSLVNMADQVPSNSSAANGSSISSDQVAVEGDPASSGIVNDGFEDVDLDSEAEPSKSRSNSHTVEFVVSEEGQVNSQDPSGSISVDTDKVDSVCRVSVTPRDDSEIVGESHNVPNGALAKDSTPDQPQEV